MADLHDEIMNLPCVEPTFVDKLAYRAGHRDARHAAAELAITAMAAKDARIAELETENATLRQAVADNVTSATMLTNMGIVNGGMNITLEGGACQLLADAFCEQFRNSGATNFVEMSFTGPDGLQLLVTMQKVDGKTPAQLKHEAEERVAELEAEAARREDYIEALHAERVGGSAPSDITLAAKSATLDILAA